MYKLCFQDASIPSLKVVGCKIIFFTTFWCKTLNNGSLLNLSLILILDTNDLINWRGVCKKHFFTIFGFLFLVRSNRCLPVVAGMSFFFSVFCLLVRFQIKTSLLVLPCYSGTRDLFFLMLVFCWMNYSSLLSVVDFGSGFLISGIDGCLLVLLVFSGIFWPLCFC